MITHPAQLQDSLVRDIEGREAVFALWIWRTQDYVIGQCPHCRERYLLAFTSEHVALGIRDKVKRVAFYRGLNIDVCATTVDSLLGHLARTAPKDPLPRPVHGVLIDMKREVKA